MFPLSSSCRPQQEEHPDEQTNIQEMDILDMSVVDDAENDDEAASVKDEEEEEKLLTMDGIEDAAIKDEEQDKVEEVRDT